MAIDSIVAIPVERFDLDLVTPSPKCIKRKGKCIPFTFPDAPDQSTVVKFVTADEDAAEELPEGIANPNEKLLYVSGDTPIVDITGRALFLLLSPLIVIAVIATVETV